MEVDKKELAKQVGQYIENIAADPIVKQFIARNEKKSKFMAEKDKEFFDAMFQYMEKFAKALILTNANQTFKLTQILTACKSLDEKG